MSPIETAKAFQAPMLQNADPNANASKLVKGLGERPIRYGTITRHDSGQELLEMNDPRHIKVPQSGQVFSE